jgi:hypothetical protein
MAYGPRQRPAQVRQSLEICVQCFGSAYEEKGLFGGYRFKHGAGRSPVKIAPLGNAGAQEGAVQEAAGRQNFEIILA